MGSAGDGLDWLGLEPKWNGGGGLIKRHGLFGFWAQVWRKELKKSSLALGIREAKDPDGEEKKI